MSRPDTLPDDWSRPQLQRQELGPMLYDYGLAVYDQVEAVLTEPYFKPPKVTNHTQVHYFLKKMTDTLRVMDEPDVLDPDNPRRMITDFVGENSQHMRNDRLVGLTTLHPSVIIDEGLMSGVVTPVNFALHLHNLETTRHVRDVERYANQAYVPPEVLRIDANDMADRIDSPEFRMMLRQLAHAPNGFLGRMSTDTDSSDSGYIHPRFSCFVTFSYRYGPEVSPFVFDQAGRVIGFGDDFLAFKKDRLHEYNKVHFAGSGGCPVRHTDFKIIGEAATKYFKQLGHEDGRPVETGESLIDRGARLASTALRLAAG